jgi:hypothetical protein
LEQRVLAHRLVAGLCVQLSARDNLLDQFLHAVGALVAVVPGIGDQCTVAVQQGEIAAPGVNADAGEGASVACGSDAETLLHLRP